MQAASRGAKPQFLVNAKGDKKAVVLNLKEYEDLMDTLEDFKDSIDLLKAELESTSFKPYEEFREDVAESVNYRIIIEKKAEKEAGKIPRQYRSVIDRAIRSLSSDPRPHGSKKLIEKEGYRIRTGNYRILYTIDDAAQVVVVYRIKPKDESTYK